ncbi:TetR/AcrR family transcriptional regulator [Paenibacillus sp. BC26]|uniref:TetR/AcrR family transcriptional regulator n=1 Tax=Paenibacillus sp. BC26 TaxID=1881032 RepID=UPI0008E7D914|nr:TetR/AcrR family transcriptional regulator [Paenibacillus sp. BC26]SFS52397.1 transcriptional regulator, TetR family [Paenibacillus sp. BC26]
MQQRSERKDAARHRELILDTASQLFHEHGVESVSMHQIAKCAGVGQGTLYRRYSSKAELCMELLTDRFERFAANISAYLALEAQLPVRERMETFLSRWIDFIATEMQWFNAIQPDAWCSDDRENMLNSPPFQFVTGVLKNLLDEAVAAGLAPSVDTEFAAFHITISMSPIAFLFFTDDRGQTTEQMKAKYISYYSSLFLGR